MFSLPRALVWHRTFPRATVTIRRFEVGGVSLKPWTPLCPQTKRHAPAVHEKATATLLTVREAASRLGLSVSALRQWVLLRKIAYHKIGRAVRIDMAEVDRILAAGYVPARNTNQ